MDHIPDKEKGEYSSLKGLNARISTRSCKIWNSCSSDLDNGWIISSKLTLSARVSALTLMATQYLFVAASSWLTATLPRSIISSRSTQAFTRFSPIGSISASNSSSSTEESWKLWNYSFVSGNILVIFKKKYRNNRLHFQEVFFCKEITLS